MTIYKAWVGSNHGITYTVGYFEIEEDAINSIKDLNDTGSSPSKGVEIIHIIGQIHKEKK